MNYFKLFLLNLTWFFFIYIIYVFPIDVLRSIITNNNILNIYSFYVSLLIYFIFILIYKYKAKTNFVRFLIIQYLGVGFLSFWVVSIVYIVNYISNIDSVLAAILSLTVICILSLISFFKGKLIKIKKLDILSSKIKNELKFVFVSDLHMGSNSKIYLKRIINKINEVKFDVLLIGGDLIDSSSFNINDLKLFKKIKKPIFFVSGNHEHYLDNWDSISKSLDKYNIKNIDGKSLKFKNINIIGVSDKMTIKQKKSVVRKFYNNKKFNLILSHKPSLWTEISDFSDLMLSGHTHNGQIFPFNLFVKFKFSQVYGVYKRAKSILYVSSGSACWGPKMRLGSDNELLEISIKK